MNKYEWERTIEQLETTLRNTAGALKDFAAAWRKAELEISEEHEGGFRDDDDFTPSDN